MSPIGHLGVGFASNRLVPEVPIIVLLLASWVIDILYLIFAFAGIESINYDPFSHSLFMNIIWSVVAALITWMICHNKRTSVFIGLLVFSHWILDFISWSTLPIFFSNSPHVGFGLYDSFLFKKPNGNLIVLAIELFGFFIPGLWLYITYIKRNRKVSKEKSL